jgi:hypothetical protein
MHNAVMHMDPITDVYNKYRISGSTARAKMEPLSGHPCLIPEPMMKESSSAQLKMNIAIQNAYIYIYIYIY